MVQMPSTGGCKKSFHPQKAPRSTFFNIALQPGKSIPTSQFLLNADKCPETAFCAEFFLNLGISTPAAKVRHIFRYKFFKATYAAC